MAFWLSLLFSFLTTYFLVWYHNNHEQIGVDHDLEGVQKFHVIPVPRIGGVGVMLGFLVGLLLKEFINPGDDRIEFGLLIASLPTFIFGLVEDFTKQVSVTKRLIAPALSALIVFCFFGFHVTHLDIPYVDHLLSFTLPAVVLTCFAVSGVTSSFNLIDGFNGLASGVAIIVLLGLTAVAYQVGDSQIIWSSWSLMGGVLGFLLWNYPRGKIFLGDGGAYFIGFMVAELSILLVERHPQISPWFPLLLSVYPIFETIFTIYRRLFLKRADIGKPDAAHLHQLIYRRLIKIHYPIHDKTTLLLKRNSATSPYLWLMSLVAVVPAVCFYQNTIYLEISVLLYISIYLTIYKGMYKRHLPNWLMKTIS